MFHKLDHEFEHLCFISWPRASGDHVRRFVEACREEIETRCAPSGLRGTVFLDLSMKKGVDWERTIARALCRSICMVSVCGPLYYESNWCRREWGSMDSLGRLRLGAEHDLIFPIVAWDDDHPQEVKRLQPYDISRRLLNAGSRFRDSGWFRQVISELVDHIVTTANRLAVAECRPDCETFKLAEPAFARRPDRSESLPFNPSRKHRSGPASEFPAPDGEPGEIITFYSYKGGVGRSMAVANVGTLLAGRSPRSARPTLLIDWDLEAPGLHHFFTTDLDSEQLQAISDDMPPLMDPKQPGLIDYFFDLREKLKKGETPPDPAAYIVARTRVQGLHFMKAGRLDPSYAERVTAFDWAKFFEDFGNSLTEFRTWLARTYEYILIDSRTGITDISGICTALLPDRVVVLFAPNSQNLRGLRETIPKILEYRRASRDARPLTIVPVPSRFDALGGLKEMVDYFIQFKDTFTDIFTAAYALESCNLDKHFNEAMLPYVPSYSYIERLAVARDEPDYPGSLRAAYQRLVGRILMDVPWEKSSSQTSAG